MKFKVGDRVREKLGLGYGIGTVVNVDGNVNLVQFDRYMNGHDGRFSGKRFKNGHCWFFNDENIELAFAPTMVEYDSQVATLNVNGKKYISKCYDEPFDLEKGVMMCLLKSKGIPYNEVRTLCEKAKRLTKFKKSDIVKYIGNTYSSIKGYGLVCSYMEESKEFLYVIFPETDIDFKWVIREKDLKKVDINE